ncbi:c-type cytochrome [Alsobacter sp. KACC 23698]|uniref:C-type cytochrome n=1 Tax=Alsobacter sp. KACC 23698 TaxID=3149229 RepID=A0AAU7JMU3_9HYPH
MSSASPDVSVHAVAGGALLVAMSLAVAGCQREEREYRPFPVADESREAIALTTNSAGPSPPEIKVSGKGRTYEANAYHQSQGKKYYAWFNCNGCHANGGGDSGPPLMDDRWIYGGSIENIVQTIREGRPNGMPSFRGKIPDDQIWQIAAYVKSMSGGTSSDSAPQRNDDMHARPSESRTPPSPPGNGATAQPGPLK